MVAVVVGLHHEDREREIGVVARDQVAGVLVQHPVFVAGIPQRIQVFADPQPVLAERAVRDRFVRSLKRRLGVLQPEREMQLADEFLPLPHLLPPMAGVLDMPDDLVDLGLGPVLGVGVDLSVRFEEHDVHVDLARHVCRGVVGPGPEGTFLRVRFRAHRIGCGPSRRIHLRHPVRSHAESALPGTGRILPGAEPPLHATESVLRERKAPADEHRRRQQCKLYRSPRHGVK